METLVLQIQAPLAAWGDIAVGEYRPTADYPSLSSLHGLLAAALGIERDDAERLQMLEASYLLAIGVQAEGRLLRDYHTSQVPSRADLKKRPHATRADELAIAKHDLNTILSTRDYRQDASVLVAIQAKPGATLHLTDLAAALQKPRFILYAGRKSCPLSAPLYPRVLDAPNVKQAFVDYLSALSQRADIAVLPVRKLVWGNDFAVDEADAIGLSRVMTILRKDQVISRQGWLFGDREEHIAFINNEEPPCISA